MVRLLALLCRRPLGAGVLVASALALASWSCSTAPPAARPTPAPSPADELVAADPGRGFEYPYLLRRPARLPAQPTYLLVEPNNTGTVTDDFAVHLEAARELAENAIGGDLARTLELPFLVPVFPRPQSQWRIYTHSLDRDSLRLTSGPMRRLDLQLLAMIDDARRRLSESGVATRESVLLTGFSASGTFANRFTMLHPERVHAVATGGINGILMLPLAEREGVTLGYPLGIADLEAVAGTPFDRPAWLAVRQFIYLGADDRNDAVEFDDGYDEDEREAVHRVIGKTMQPDRWEFCQARYLDAGARVEFRTYEGVGHFTNQTIQRELIDFFRRAMVERP